ncbi:MAG TPA: MFS transporter [Ignavibacteriales bacterium]|nr:MFS transporter [Ignavibacteriales bacterium]HPD67210.1 MFS transporter [Ignavibacteriales bacterium]
MKTQNIQIYSIFITVFIDLLGFGILIPVLPTYAKNFLNANEFQVGLIIGIYSFIQFIFNPIIGQLSDKLGRKFFIVSCLVLLSLTYFLLPLAKNFSIFFILRAIAGIGGSNIGVSQAYIADITKPHERTKYMGLIGVAFGAGFMLGPLFGGLISHYLGFTYIGIAAGILSLVAAIFASITLPNTHKINFNNIDNINFNAFSNIKKLFNFPLVSFFIILFFIVTFSIANIFGTLPLLSQYIYKLKDVQIGIIMSIMGLMGILTQAFITHTIENKIGYIYTLYIGLILLTIGLFLMPLGQNIHFLIISIIIFSLGQGILQNLIPSLISKNTPKENLGNVLGINQSLAALGRTLGPIWGGFSFHFIGYKTPYITGALFSILSIFLFYNEMKGKRR